MKKANTNKQYQYANRDKTYNRNKLLHFIRRFQSKHNKIISLLDLDNIKQQILVDNTAIFLGIKKGAKKYIVQLKIKDKPDRDIVVVVKHKGDNLEWITTYPIEDKHHKIIKKHKKAKEKQEADGVKEEVEVANSSYTCESDIFIDNYNKELKEVDIRFRKIRLKRYIDEVKNKRSTNKVNNIITYLLLFTTFSIIILTIACFLISLRY